MTYSYHRNPRTEVIKVYEHPDDYKEEDEFKDSYLVAAHRNGDHWRINLQDNQSSRGYFPSIKTYQATHREVDLIAHVLAHGLIATREGATTSATAPSDVEGLLEVGTGRGRAQ